jgi:putative protease
MEETVKAQLGKRSSVYAFGVHSLRCDGPMPFLGISALNQARRDIAAKLDEMPVRALPLNPGRESASGSPSALDYTANAANRLSRELYARTGTIDLEPAYELTHRPGAELMRSRYCLRHELGMCPKLSSPACREISNSSLYLHNNGRTLTLEFHCRECEMTVK